MKAVQLAREICANYDAGKCRGIMIERSKQFIHPDYEGIKCLSKKCIYFEKILRAQVHTMSPKHEDKLKYHTGVADYEKKYV